MSARSRRRSPKLDRLRAGRDCWLGPARVPVATAAVVGCGGLAGRAVKFLHFLPVSGGDEAAEGGLQADRGEQIRLFRHFFAQ